MKALIQEHFDLIYLFLILCVLLGIFWYKPEKVTEWIAGILGAITMRIRPGGNSGNPPEIK